MYVRYGGRSNQPSYVCSWQRSDYALPLCQSASSASVEGWVAEQLLAALQPAALDASLAAAAEVEQQRRQMTGQWEHRLERARFEAQRAARQYHACEPENRLVARTLERQWDEKLREQERLEAEFARFTRTQPRPLDASDRGQIRRLAEEVPALWHAPMTTSEDRRQIARLLVDRIVLTVDPGDDKVAVRVEWAGGAVRERALHRAVRSYEGQRDWPRLSARLGDLHRSGLTPAAIAAALNGEGFVAPKRADRFSPGMVRRLLDRLGLRRRVPRCTASAGELAPGEWWLHDLARQLGVSPHTLHGWRRRGWVHSRQLSGRGGPWAVWADGPEIERLTHLKDCPRLWSNRDLLAELRVPRPRD
jgi:hypothetical protein